MRFLKYLIEKWESSFKDPEAGITEIFANPTRAEFKDILSASRSSALRYWREIPVSARGYYDKAKNIMWMWRGDVLHNIVRRKLPAASEFDLIRIEVDTSNREMYIYEPIKDKNEPEDLTNVKMVVKKIRSFAPQTKGYRIKFFRGFSQYDFTRTDLKL